MRIPSVTGSAVYSARVKSSPIVSSRASVALASPNCSTRKSGFADCTSATAARIGFTVSVACSASSASSNCTSAAWPSAETRLAPSSSSGERTFDTPSLPARAAVTSATTARKAGSEAFADSLSTKTLSSAESRNAPASMICWARPDSPIPSSSWSSFCMPTAPPMTAAATMKASQPKIAVLRWPALQRPMRAAMVLERFKGVIWRTSPGSG
jgi:hypothetical protein